MTVNCLHEYVAAYPERECERRILGSHHEGEPVEVPAPALDGPQVLGLQAAVRPAAVDEAIIERLGDEVALAGVNHRGEAKIIRRR